VFKQAAYEWSQNKSKVYSIDDENIEAIKTLVLYFTQHPEFLKCTNVKGSEPSLQKGIILCGNVGSGKTLLMRFMNECFINEYKYQIIPCDIITDRVRKEGVGALERYQRTRTANDKPNTILFDDLGIESKAKYYGDVINPMYDLILKRYRLFSENNLLTHFTTNLKPDEWEDYYDVRTASRLKEMCNIIVLGGKQNSKDRRI